MVPVGDLAWVSIRQAGEFYGVSRRTIYNWIAAGKVTTQRTPGGSTRIAIDKAAWAGSLSQEQAERRLA